MCLHRTTSRLDGDWFTPNRRETVRRRDRAPRYRSRCLAACLHRGFASGNPRSWWGSRGHGRRIGRCGVIDRGRSATVAEAWAGASTVGGAIRGNAHFRDTDQRLSGSRSAFDGSVWSVPTAEFRPIVARKVTLPIFVTDANLASCGVSRKRTQPLVTAFSTGSRTQSCQTYRGRPARRVGPAWDARGPGSVSATRELIGNGATEVIRQQCKHDVLMPGVVREETCIWASRRSNRHTLRLRESRSRATRMRRAARRVSLDRSDA